MKVQNLKELQKVIQLCRKLGVEAIELDGIKMNLGPEPRKSFKAPKVDQEVFPEESIKVPAFTPMPDKIVTDELSEEQLMYYSSAGRESDSITKDN